MPRAARQRLAAAGGRVYTETRRYYKLWSNDRVGVFCRRSPHDNAGSRHERHINQQHLGRDWSFRVADRTDACSGRRLRTEFSRCAVHRFHRHLGVPPGQRGASRLADQLQPDRQDLGADPRGARSLRHPDADHRRDARQFRRRDHVDHCGTWRGGSCCRTCPSGHPVQCRCRPDASFPQTLQGG